MLLDAQLIHYDLSETALGFCANFTHRPLFDSGELPERESERFTRIAVNCLKLEHDSVFEFAHLLFRVDCPIFVARQLVRHRNGTFLEKSLRHLEPSEILSAEDDDEFYDAYNEAIARYRKLREDGYRKEEARIILPLATPTAFLWKINLRSLFNVFYQRLSMQAQSETREVVVKMWKETADVYPNLLHEWLVMNPEKKHYIEKV